MTIFNNMLPWASKNRDRYTHGVEFTSKDHVVKYFEEGDVLAEYTKAKAVAKALTNTPFEAAHALRYNQSLNFVEYERIKGSTLFQVLLEKAYQTTQFSRVLELNDAAAELLSTLHKQMYVPNARYWMPNGFLVHRASKLGCKLNELDDVFLHCDFSPVNLLIGADDKIVVIDPSPNSYFTHYACLKGNRLVDIATYTTKLFWPFRLSAYSVRWRNFTKILRENFVSIYEIRCGQTIDRKLLNLFEDAVVRCFVESKTKYRFVQWLAMGVGRVSMHDARK